MAMSFLERMFGKRAEQKKEVLSSEQSIEHIDKKISRVWELLGDDYTSMQYEELVDMLKKKIAYLKANLSDQDYEIVRQDFLKCFPKEELEKQGVKFVSLEMLRQVNEKFDFYRELFKDSIKLKTSTITKPISKPVQPVDKNIFKGISVDIARRYEGISKPEQPKKVAEEDTRLTFDYEADRRYLQRLQYEVNNEYSMSAESHIARSIELQTRTMPDGTLMPKSHYDVNMEYLEY